MNSITRSLILILLVMFAASVAFAQQQPGKHLPKAVKGKEHLINTRIDNMTYWKQMAEKGYVEVAPVIPIETAIYTGSKINSRGVLIEDSPDVPLTTINSTQSENSVFVDPNDNTVVLQSNNSTENPVGNLYGANDFFTFDGGETWEGEVEGAGGPNSGDPATAISNNGTWYVGYIHSNLDQGISYSTDQGQTWVPVHCGLGGYILDKNHMWVDNSTASPYDGYVYSAWTSFQGGANNNEIEIVRSSDNGQSYSAVQNISSEVNAGSHNQGVNIGTGPDGQVYVIWAIYDGWPTDESSIGFAKSYDGGTTYEPAERIIEDIRGIRTTETSKNMRVNSFPSMAVDISNGPNRGTIYIVWTNIGIPGINTGSDMDVYMIKSSDEGDTWSDPIRVNQDPAGLGKQHYFPWITCDKENGTLSAIFYDDRNISSSQAEVYCAVSSDAGDTWEDFKVSDVSFTPSPIPGLAGGYMGDYLGITSNNRMVYPVWSDNRLGHVMAFASPFETGPPPDQPWVIFDSYSIDDSQGNGNGQADFGESMFLDLTMKNIGDQPATSVNVVLSTDNEHVTITDDSENFGDFAVEEVKTMAGAFGLTLSNYIPDGDDIEFTVTATDANDSTFASYFKIIAHSPALNVGNMVVSDPAGNNNGRLDPGETVDLIVYTSNPGDFAANDATATLFTNSPDVTLNTTTFDFGNIEAGQMRTATFSLTVSETALTGTAVAFDYSVTSEFHSAEATFVQKIGLILEDFETGDFSSFDWTFGGNSAWTIVESGVYEGSYCAASGNIPDNATSELYLEYAVMFDDTISFYRKVSSESGYDYLSFYIDDILQDQWSGEEDWDRAAYPVTSGAHTFKWVYNKDVYVTSGQDKVWIDYVVLPAELRTSASAGPDDSTCEDTPYPLNGTATNYTSVLWSTPGTGAFDDPALLNATYTPSPEDIVAGAVELTLTVYGPDITVSDQMVLSFDLIPLAYAGSDQGSCGLRNVVFEEAQVENNNGLLWTTTGLGSFVDATQLMAEYIPFPDDLGQDITFVLTAYSTGKCQDTFDEVTVTFFPTIDPVITGPGEVCHNTTVEYNIPLLENYTYNWEITGGTIQTGQNTNEITVIWETTGSENYLFAHQTDNNTQCMTSEGLIVTVNELPQPMISGDDSVCENESELIYSTDLVEGHSYVWYIEGGTITSGENTHEVAVNWGGIGGGMLTLMETNDATTCQASVAYAVSINALPEVSLGNDTSICHNHVLHLDAGNAGAEYVWSTGETTQAITIDSTGAGIGGTKVITVLVTNAQGCASQDAISVYFEDCTGIPENAYDLGVNIFPNPTKGMFTLELNPEQEDVISIRILNAVGAVVYRQENVPLNGPYLTEFNLDQFGDGLYYLFLDSRKVHVVKKIVVQQ
jgi:hypothetical protein